MDKAPVQEAIVCASKLSGINVWSGFRKNILNSAISFFTLLIFPVSAIFIFHSDFAVFLAVVVNFGFLVRNIVKLGQMECPNCHLPFFYKGYYGNLLSRRCKNCGIRIGDKLSNNAKNT